MNIGMDTRSRVPELFRPILWSYDFDRLHPEKDQRTLIVQAINYGTLDHWRWIAQRYGIDAVREILSSVPATELRPRVRRLTELLFDIDHFNYAPRGTH
jgi:hypothetical protein